MLGQLLLYLGDFWGWGASGLGVRAGTVLY